MCEKQGRKCERKGRRERGILAIEREQVKGQSMILLEKQALRGRKQAKRE